MLPSDARVDNELVPVEHAYACLGPAVLLGVSALRERMAVRRLRSQSTPKPARRRRVDELQPAATLSCIGAVHMPEQVQRWRG